MPDKIENVEEDQTSLIKFQKNQSNTKLS